MALKMNVETYSGINITDAYIKLSDNINIRKADTNNFIIDARIEVYINNTYKDNNLTKIKDVKFFDSYSIPYNLESVDNPLKQMYDYIKTLPEFENAIDV